MGFQVVSYAFDQKVPTSSAKLAFLALANNANEETGETFPSIAYIRDKTALNRKTIVQALDQLVATGLIEDTGKRRGSTQRVKVYRVIGAPFKTVPKSELLNSPKIGTGIGPILPINRPENGTRNQSGINHGINHNPLPPEGGESVRENSCSAEDRNQDVVQHGEAKRLFARIAARNFDEELRDNQWSARRMQWLEEIVPLKRSDWELVDWYYSLPGDAPARLEGGKLRRSFDSLLQNFVSEVQKIRSVKKELRAAPGATGRPQEPKNWQEIFHRLFPDRPRPPQSFWNLQADERRTIESPEWWHPAAKDLWGERDDLPESIFKMSTTARAEVLEKIKAPN